MKSLRTHYAEISKHFDGADGSLTVEAVARRSGIMRYRSDSGDRLELVPPDLIDARDEHGRPVMGMLAGAPNTNEHPAQVIRYSTDSRKAVQVGKVNEEIHIYSDADGERSVKVRFDVSDPETIADIRNGRKTGVSLGYLCNVVPENGEYRGKPYTHRQAMPFSIDHLAIVANPRNPGAVITRFDSDDIAWLSDESKTDAPNTNTMPIVRVDACCAACDGNGKPGCSDDIEPDEPKNKKKKVKTDAEEMPMIPMIFVNGIHSATVEQAQALWTDGTIDRVTMDGSDYFMAADMALTLAHQGILHEDAFVAKAGVAKGGGQCGRGWVGVKGSCKRLAKGTDRAGAQKSALKEFANEQRIKKSGNMYGTSPAQKAKENWLKESKNTTPAPIDGRSSVAKKAKAKLKSEVESLGKLGRTKTKAVAVPSQLEKRRVGQNFKTANAVRASSQARTTSSEESNRANREAILKSIERKKGTGVKGGEFNPSRLKAEAAAKESARRSAMTPKQRASEDKQLAAMTKGLDKALKPKRISKRTSAMFDL